MPKGIWLAVYDKIENIETLKKYAIKATAAISKIFSKSLPSAIELICLENIIVPCVSSMPFPE